MQYSVKSTIHTQRKILQASHHVIRLDLSVIRSVHVVEMKYYIAMKVRVVRSGGWKRKRGFGVG